MQGEVSSLPASLPAMCCTRLVSGFDFAAHSTVIATQLSDHCQSYAGIEDAEIAVFRFTLGIPGFDDALIPRVVGSLGAALLIANHLSDPAQATDAQAQSSPIFFRHSLHLSLLFPYVSELLCRWVLPSS